VPVELTAMENVVLLPHIGSGTSETRRAMGRLFLDNLVGWFETGAAVTPVRECAAVGKLTSRR
jgi:hydroxypyruvate reductase